MTSSLTKKLVRDIWHAKGQFIAAALVVACGLSVYVSLYSTYKNLKLSRDSYYRQFRFADFFIDLERATTRSVRLVEEIPGVLRAHGRIVKDVPLEVEGDEESAVGRLISMPELRRPPIDDIYIVSGSYFSGPDERQAIVNQRFCEANNLRPGDSFLATINERQERMHIVGTCYSPEYVYPIRNPQQFAPNDKGFAIVFVKKSFAEGAFNMGGAVNNIIGLLDPDADLAAVLDAAKKRLETYGVYHHYGRQLQLSHQYVNEEIRGLRGSAVVLPSVFLGIAALIVHVIMSRITERQRTQIGLLCALGYSKTRIAVHYASYALVVAGLGVALGALTGQWLANEFRDLYRPFFRFPSFESRVHPSLFGTAVALSVGACVFGTLVSVRRIARMQPALAMRPAAPPSGRRIMLERVGFVWSRLGLEWRTTIRNMVRVPTRTAMTVIGVMIATVIIVIGSAMTDFFDAMVDFQFNKVDRSDLHVDFVSEQPLSVIGDVARLDAVVRAEGILQYGFELRNGWRKKTVLVMGLPRDSRLFFVRDASGRRLGTGEDGLLVPERLVKSLGLARGSRLVADPYVRAKEDVTLAVRGVAEQFVGLVAYADRAYLCSVLGEPDMVNGLLLRVEEGKLDSVMQALEDVPGVTGAVSNRRIMEGVMETVAGMIVATKFVLSLFAGVIAFAVIYNSSTINISERERELASLRAEGLSAAQTARMGTNEIVPLGLLGIVLGLPLAFLACKGLARLYETDIYKVPAVTHPRTYVIAAALVVVFLLLCRYICGKKVTRIDIIRTLKTRE